MFNFWKEIINKQSYKLFHKIEIIKWEKIIRRNF